MLQNATAILLQNASGVLLENVTVITKYYNFITKCDSYYKMQRYKLRQYKLQWNYIMEHLKNAKNGLHLTKKIQDEEVF